MSVAPPLTVPGVAPLTDDQLDRQLVYAVGMLPTDARVALRWLRRGHLASSTLWPTFVRRALLQFGGVRIGRSVYGLERGWFQSSQITIGDGAFIAAGCHFEGDGPITIGANTMLGPAVTLLTSHHELGADGSIARFADARPVAVGDGCWLGARVTVMPGVQIEHGAVIAAASVVTKNCEAGGVYAGVPARRIR